MRHLLASILATLALIVFTGRTRAGAPSSAPGADKPRVMVLTDISNEPDDEESLVRFLVYSNEFSAEGTSDPDSNAVRATWWIYPEAGTPKQGATLTSAEGLRTEVRLPPVKKPATVHVILQVEDDGNPHLYAYRRAVLEVTP